MVGFTFGVKYFENSNNVWAYFLTYFLFTIFLNIISVKVHNRYLDNFTKILSFPLAIIFFLFQIMVPTVTIMVQSLYYIVLSTSIPFLLLKLNNYYQWIDLNSETETFFQLTISIIISVTFYKYILDLTYKISLFRIKSSKKMKKYKLDELIEYIINRQNIRFAIYVSFFIYIFIYSFQMLENSSLFVTDLRDKAILQSFLCFLAYDRLLLNSKIVALMPSKLLNKFLISIIGKDEKKEDL